MLASLAGATRSPKPLPVPTRVGGFDGEAGFWRCVQDNDITAVLDATHPFAERITRRTARLCAERGMPYLRLDRPAWQPQPEDRWVMIQSEDQAAAHVGAGQVVFLATGRQTLERFAGLAVAQVIARVVDPPQSPFPFAGGRFEVGRPPFDVASEVALFQRLKVDWLVVKNAGGSGGWAKLEAARALGLPVLMLERPARPEAPVVETVAAALGWVRAL
ncbi:Precorrin-6A reductase [Flavimaricola marinus]|uniref:Precorrin-6A reductase n=1 Tax=Flavimaricola marinus TaxID=1819565 RepID=A0A238LGG9_9RHOB|nr:Precorrin-6A reductase [Flavimaricola marinus]